MGGGAITCGLCLCSMLWVSVRTFVYQSTLLTLVRMDLPMGGYGSPRDALLPAED